MHDEDFDPDDDRPSGICSGCFQEIDGVQIDFGYGLTERGSHVENDVDLQWVSPCCEAALLSVEEYTELQYTESYRNTGE